MHGRLARVWCPRFSVFPARPHAKAWTPNTETPARLTHYVPTGDSCSSSLRHFERLRSCELLQLLQSDAAILNLSAICFKADGAGLRNFERSLQHLAVAG